MSAPSPDGVEARRSTLEQRSRDLAAAPPEARRETRTLVVFTITGRQFAVPAGFVRFILDARGVSPLSGAPMTIIGAVMARSRLVPVLDLNAVLGLPPSGLVDATRVLVLDDHGDWFALAADEVEGHREVESEQLTPLPEGEAVRFLGPARLNLLDVERLGVDLVAK